MAKTIQIQTPVQENEARLVAGMANKQRRIQNELYAYCSDYFWDNNRGVFFADDNAAAEILQNSFITFWEKIERRDIYVEDGVLKGKDNMPFRGSILTYFMKIARNKYFEYIRSKPDDADIDIELARTLREKGFDSDEYIDMIYDSGENLMLDIIADVISKMPERCYQILTKFYYEEKELDTILNEIPTISSYNALKTRKNKCLNTLRDNAIIAYEKKIKQN